LNSLFTAYKQRYLRVQASCYVKIRSWKSLRFLFLINCNSCLTADLFIACFFHLTAVTVAVLSFLSPESTLTLGFLSYFTVLTSLIPVTILNFFALKASSATPEEQYFPGPGLIVAGSKNLFDSGIENLGTEH